MKNYPELLDQISAEVSQGNTVELKIEKQSLVLVRIDRKVKVKMGACPTGGRDTANRG